MFEKMWCKPIVCFFFLIDLSLSSPVFRAFDTTYNSVFIPKDFCLLPPELGYSGVVKFIEDCQSLDRYQTIPIPGDFFHKLGTHPVVCCPEILPKSSLCFASDAWCPTYEDPVPIKLTQEQEPQKDNRDEEENIPTVTEITYQVQEIPKMSDHECRQNGQYKNLSGFGELSQCVPLNQCGKILDNEYSPKNQTQHCGFDENQQIMMICCPEDYVTEPEFFEQKPRFPIRNGKPRQVVDKSDQCRKWRDNDGCSLDKELVISKLDPDNGKVISKVLFDFMQGACLKTCSWSGRKGCIDEHPRCPEWARKGMCIINPFFMTHTCRESCGVCGFLSPNNKDEQVVGGLSYTDFTKNNFDCGRYKPLCEINNEDCDEQKSTESPTVTMEPIRPVTDSFDLRDTNTDDDVFFSIDPSQTTGYTCGATMVTDRWVVAAAHCYDVFEKSANNKPRHVKINTIRDNTEHIEIIEIKKVYQHPLYKFPTLYDDVAVLELGRRVEYNYDLFGDTPSCIDLGQDNEGRTATVQGYGKTENGIQEGLLEANVTVITNEQCKEYLDFNVTNNNNIRQQIDTALPYGLNYGLLCVQGEMNEKGVFRGSCKGDSGGPLTAPNDKGRKTLIGIVSGGIGCGKGYPGWYTKVSFHTRWIKCIIQRSAFYENNFEKVREVCAKVVQKPPKSIVIDDLIFGDTNLV